MMCIGMDDAGAKFTFLRPIGAELEIRVRARLFNSAAAIPNPP